jgi:hypothetical protein
MVQVNYWIHLEDHAWDTCPETNDRITGELEW